jgi:hypothetical protein
VVDFLLLWRVVAFLFLLTRRLTLVWLGFILGQVRVASRHSGRMSAVRVFGQLCLAHFISYYYTMQDFLWRA